MSVRPKINFFRTYIYLEPENIFFLGLIQNSDLGLKFGFQESEIRNCFSQTTTILIFIFRS